MVPCSPDRWPGGPDRQVLELTKSGMIRPFYPIDDGIYYIPQPDPMWPWAHELRFLDFKTNKHETLSRFQARRLQGLTGPPDRKTILVAGALPSAGDDLMLIRNFR